MAKNYEVGKSYYLPVNVCVDKSNTGSGFPVVIEFNDGEFNIYNSVKDRPGILLTADEIVHTNSDAKSDEIKVLKSENERLSNQNEELGTKVDDLEAELQNAQKSIDYNNKMEKSRTRLVDEQTMTIYRKDKVINVLIDKIVALEMMLDEEMEKNNG